MLRLRRGWYSSQYGGHTGYNSFYAVSEKQSIPGKSFVLLITNWLREINYRSASASAAVHIELEDSKINNGISLLMWFDKKPISFSILIHEPLM